MVFSVSRRALKSIAFCILFAPVAGDAIKQSRNDTVQQAANVAANVIQQAKETSVHAFDKIKDKISISSEDIQTLLHLASQKEIDSKKSRSFTTTLFNIIFPSSRPAINALLATAYISGPPNFLLALCPPNIDPSSLSIMVAFAVGGLLGDTFFHLLPEIFLGEDDSETKIRIVALEPNRNLLLGVFIFIGLATFMAMDKALRIATGAAHNHGYEDRQAEKQAERDDPDLKREHEQKQGHRHLRKVKDKAKEHFDQTDYRLMDNLQEVASNESPEQQKERIEAKPYNDTMVGNRKTRDIIAELAATNQEIRRRSTASSQEKPNLGSKQSPQNQNQSQSHNRNQSQDQPRGQTSQAKYQSAHSSVTMQPETTSEKPTTTRSTSSSSSSKSDSNLNSNSKWPANTQEKDSTQNQNPQSPLNSATPSTTTPRDINPSVKLAGLLNLLADFTHNITDGLALSTSFYSSPALGATTTMAVFFHEIPHEVGDFALLIQSGFTKRNAMAAQFVTAIGAFLGTIIGILVQEYGSGEGAATDSLTGMKSGIWGTSLQWSDTLLPFTAGTFLYVGTVGVIPELLENEKGKTRGQEFVRTLMQFGAMAAGALIMIAISWN